MIHLIKDFVTENDQFVTILFPLVQRIAISTNFSKSDAFFGSNAWTEKRKSKTWSSVYMFHKID